MTTQTFGQPETPKPPRKVSPLERGRWHLTLQSVVDCGECGATVVLAGQGTFRDFQRFLDQHIKTCSKRRFG